MSDLLSEAAQAMIDSHRLERDAGMSIDAMLDEGLGMATVPAAKVETQRRPRYTADAMVDLMVAYPEYTHKQFAEHFGYKASWFAGVLISQNFQMVLERRRAEVVNPMLTGTMDDMFRALTVQALTVLQARLESPVASEDLILKAAALGVKALGMGTANGAPLPPAAPSSLAELAFRLSAPPMAAPAVAASRDFTIDATLEELKR